MAEEILVAVAVVSIELHFASIRPSLINCQRIVILDGAGHWVQHDRLDEFVGLTREFLAE